MNSTIKPSPVARQVPARSPMNGTRSWRPIACLVLGCCGALAQAADPVMHVRAERAIDGSSPSVAYRLSLLKKALEASRVPFVIEPCDTSSTSLSDRRIAQRMRDDQGCNVIATLGGAAFARELHMIPVPLYLGGGGYRVFAVTQQGLAQVAGISDLAGLRQVRIGSGTAWTDSDIMEGNGLQVVRADFSHLYAMLRAGRFDLLTRSLFEIGAEVAQLPTGDQVSIEPRLLLHYPADLFFYVAPNQPRLEAALTSGMIQLYCSGELLRHLQEHTSTRNMWRTLRPDRRIRIELPNHRLTAEVSSALAQYAPADLLQVLRPADAGPAVHQPLTNPSRARCRSDRAQPAGSAREMKP